MAELPDIRVDGATEREDIEKVVSKVKPTWPLDQLQIKELKGGVSALIRHCFIPSNPDDAITIRATNLMARGSWKELPPRSEPGLEKKVLKAVTERGCGPRVIAFFENGYCYEYIAGKPVLDLVNPPKTIGDNIFKLVAHQMAAIHCLKPEGVDCTKSNYFGYLEDILERKYPARARGLPSKEVVRRELHEMKGYMRDCRIGICHGDAHMGNVLHNADTESVTFVDWELVHVAYQAVDVGQVTKILGIPEIMKVSLELSGDFEQQFVRHYLEEWFRLQGKTEDELTSEEEDKFYGQVKLGQLATDLLVVIILTAVSPQPQQNDSSSSSAPSDLEEAFSDFDFTPNEMVLAFYKHYVNNKKSIVEKYVKQKR